MKNIEEIKKKIRDQFNQFTSSFFELRDYVEKNDMECDWDFDELGILLPDVEDLLR